MTQPVTRGRVRSLNNHVPTATGNNSDENSNLAALSAVLSDDFQLQIYGGDARPLYDVVTTYGSVVVSNTLDTAFQSYGEMRNTLKDGEAGYIYSQEYSRFTLAIKLPGNGVVFAGLLHDKSGAPRVEDSLTLCRVIANRDLELEDQTIITKGQEFLKALPQAYVGTLTKAA